MKNRRFKELKCTNHEFSPHKWYWILYNWLMSANKKSLKHNGEKTQRRKNKSVKKEEDISHSINTISKS